MFISIKKHFKIRITKDSNSAILNLITDTQYRDIPLNMEMFNGLCTLFGNILLGKSQNVKIVTLDGKDLLVVLSDNTRYHTNVYIYFDDSEFKFEVYKGFKALFYKDKKWVTTPINAGNLILPGGVDND